MNKKRSFFKRKKKAIIIFTVIIFIGIIIIFNLRSQREKSIKVTVEKAEKHDLTSKISASGEVKPKKNVNISAHIPGRIVKIGVEEGQSVKAEDFLLKLDSTQYQANADRAQALIHSYRAEFIRAEAELKKDKSSYKRYQKLFEEKLISEEQLEAAEAQYDISKAQQQAIMYQIDQAQASLQSALDDLSKTAYSSPIDGIITSLRVEEGEIAMIGTMNNPGTILMTIADLSVMEVEVEVDETDVIGVEIGQQAEVRVDAFPDQDIKGKVTEIGSSALQKVTSSEESRDFKVIITLENPPENLKPGLSATADIITAEKTDILAIPISALVLREKEEKEGEKNDEQEEGVYVVEENRVKFFPVEKGIMGEMMIEITTGLEEGQDIVVGPYSALRQLKDDTLIKPEEKKKEE
ncbi:MAG TPA: efflux RND transporter periplasmic adaptor subunit [Candidatus Aminicenantes bacterium]|nr:efflux RND transporter periplasmic adaptor subunit [Candidatus Aminicenantes bacterium]HEB36193.1 efflux RND transporter periplasmic adaptor subunit [Candidatus Aminicenantes bacterium]